ncbi:MAG: hypothetical protein GX603_00630 [Chloroflexi bacterium]|nr:hypothetical protein [Chloroflexota bacterium]
MMQSSVMITSELLQQVGLPAVLEATHCRTPQGSRLKNAARVYGVHNRRELEQELEAVGNLTTLIRQKHPQLVETTTQLARLRELRGTFSRLEHGTVLDDTEFFELKGALAIFSRLTKVSAIIEAAGVSFKDTSKAAMMLDPAGKKNPAFHIYSDYSPTLDDIRARKRVLEKQISKSKGAERKTLLTRRAMVIAEEDQEEDRIRRELGSKLAESLPQMQHNAEACGLLDFRLAKAELAVRWNGCRPALVSETQPAILTNITHPLIASHLEKQGQEFTPISIEIRRGSTVLSGANMGGKSVALKTVFLGLLMAQLGYFPVAESLQTPIYDFFAFETSQDGDLHRGLSSFGLEAVKIRDHYRRSKTRNGLIIMDEPCRGTNPGEATAIVNALSKSYSISDSSFLIATHYPISPSEGIRFYQIRGIRPETLAQQLPPLPEEPTVAEADKSKPSGGLSALAQPDLKQDLIRVRRIQKMMDYRLEEIDGPHAVPSGAIKIAELLGVDDELVREMKTAWQEEQWQN